MTAHLDPIYAKREVPLKFTYQESQLQNYLERLS